MSRQSKEKNSAYSKKRYLLKKEHILTVTKKWQKLNKEKILKKQKEWRKNNKEKYLQKARIASIKWRKNNPESVIGLRQRTRDKLRREVLSAYGGQCTCCGETIIQFLAIDHMDGNGRKQRRDNGLKSSQAFYSWLRKNNYPPRFQILCHNCNCAKGYYKICPHQTI